MDSAHSFRPLRPGVSSGGGETGRAGRHGDDGEAGRVRRARQHHARRAAREPRIPARTDTSGSARRRCATPSWCWRRRRAGSPVFCCRAGSPDGERNAFHLQRLKPKLGNRSNASSEVEFHGAWARLVGEEGRGVATIIEMVQHTRLDCAIASAALMRRALVEALHHATPSPRLRPGADRPAADAKCAGGPGARVRSGHALGHAAGARVRRRRSALSRAWRSRWASTGCRSGRPPHVAEALECLGGNGYVEECILPRLYREAPLNSIWEGSGNVIALDVLRAIAKSRRALERVLAEIRLARDPRIGKYRGGTEADVSEAARGGWPSGWRSRCRHRCWSASARRRWRTRSANRVCASGEAGPSARCRRPSISMRCCESRDWRSSCETPIGFGTVKRVSHASCAHSSAG